MVECGGFEGIILFEVVVVIYFGFGNILKDVVVFLVEMLFV